MTLTFTLATNHFLPKSNYKQNLSQFFSSFNSDTYKPQTSEESFLKTVFKENVKKQLQTSLQVREFWW